MTRESGYAALCLIAAIVLTAADARAQPVLLHSRCAGERSAALLEQLRVVEAEVQSSLDSVLSTTQIEQWLSREPGGVGVIVDLACDAQVHGHDGEHYEVSAQLPTRAWAVRIAELAYALSPYDAQPHIAVAPQVAVHEVTEPEATDAPDRSWTVGMGPALRRVSGGDGAVPALGAHLAWQARPHLALTLSGTFALSRTSVGDGERRALVRTMHVGMGPRVSLPLGDTLSVDLTLTYGALWVHAEGRALPPLGNRGDDTFASMAVVALGASYDPVPAWGVRCEASMGRTLPTVRVVLGDQERDLAALALSLYAALQFHF